MGKRVAHGVSRGDYMATIVDIRSASSVRAARAQSVRTNGSAEILLFTGVRYERWEEPRGAPATGHASRRGRDRLELED